MRGNEEVKSVVEALAEASTYGRAGERARTHEGDCNLGRYSSSGEERRGGHCSFVRSFVRSFSHLIAAAARIGPLGRPTDRPTDRGHSLLRPSPWDPRREP